MITYQIQDFDRARMHINIIDSFVFREVMDKFREKNCQIKSILVNDFNKDNIKIIVFVELEKFFSIPKID